MNDDSTQSDKAQPHTINHVGGMIEWRVEMLTMDGLRIDYQSGSAIAPPGWIALPDDSQLWHIRLIRPSG